MEDLGGLVDLYQLCSSPVLSGNHLCDAHWGGHTTGMENLFLWPTLILSVSTLQGLPIGGKDPTLPECHTQRVTVFVIPLFPQVLSYMHI
jgi:hypothetical protein